MTVRVFVFALVTLLLAMPEPVRGNEIEPAVPVVDLYVGSLRGLDQADTQRLRRGGVFGVVLSLEPGGSPLEASYLDLLSFLSRSSELRMPGCRRKRPGMRTWLAIDDSSELARAPSSIGLWTTRGVRLFRLLRNQDNELATSSATPAPVLTGLTAAGAALVRGIHASGGLVDVSGASSMTIRDVVELARQTGAPVVASHANARFLTDDYRNLGDAELQDIASTGGVVGLTFQPRQLAHGREAELRDVVRHVLHMTRVAGVDHVAIGSGFETGFRPPHELMNAGRYPRLVRALKDAGMSHASVRKVLATNALRVLCPPNRAQP